MSPSTPCALGPGSWRGGRPGELGGAATRQARHDLLSGMQSNSAGKAQGFPASSACSLLLPAPGAGEGAAGSGWGQRGHEQLGWGLHGLLLCSAPPAAHLHRWDRWDRAGWACSKPCSSGEVTACARPVLPEHPQVGSRQEGGGSPLFLGTWGVKSHAERVLRLLPVSRGGHELGECDVRVGSSGQGTLCLGIRGCWWGSPGLLQLEQPCRGHRAAWGCCLVPAGQAGAVLTPGWILGSSCLCLPQVPHAGELCRWGNR